MSLIEAFDEQYNNINSWKHSTNKVKTSTDLTLRISNLIEGNMQTAHRIIRSGEETISSYRNLLKNLYDSVAFQRRVLESEKVHLTHSIHTVTKDLDILIKHDKVEDIVIEGSDIVVYTKPIYMYDLQDNRYYLGNCNFRIDIFNNNITFDNDNRRQGYWNCDDVHPHISGIGEPCWGSIDTTIVELCSQYQVYSIAMMCINFLEQANTEDIAGEYVISWDKVDENGTIIAEGGSYGLPNHYKCDDCENWRNLDDQFTVFGNVDTTYNEEEDITEYGDPYDECIVCSSCRENNYRYSEDVEAWISRHN